MAIITLTTDFGFRDHYTAAVKANLIKVHPNVRLIDVSHHIEPFNISHGSYVLSNVFREFPEGSIHLVSVHKPSRTVEPCIAFQSNGHYFFGVDNGLLSLVTEDEPTEVIKLHGSEEPQKFTFFAKDILVPAINKLVGGAALGELGTAMPGMRKMLNPQLRVTKNLIAGNIVHIDHYGNLVTNIKKEEFERVSESRSFMLKFGRENTDVISPTYLSPDEGDCMAVFNSNGYLEIAINKGKADRLLGMRSSLPVMIQFHPEV
ncbi:MAG: S-adenosyl-l-methionine hydroxide adenosyltransferase family protein [Cytophagaceae bacterium]